MNQEYYDMLKSRIEERKKTMELYYSKLKVKKSYEKNISKVEKEIEELLSKIKNLDRRITILTPIQKKWTTKK